MSRLVNCVFVLGFGFTAMIFLTAPETSRQEARVVADHMLDNAEIASGAYLNMLFEAGLRDRIDQADAPDLELAALD